jgi:hypothetical protein
VTNPRGHEEDSGLLSYSKSQRIHHKIFRFRTSQEPRRERKPRRKEEMRVGER